jgi:hypothetical protein
MKTLMNISEIMIIFSKYEKRIYFFIKIIKLILLIEYEWIKHYNIVPNNLNIFKIIL